MRSDGRAKMVVPPTPTVGFADSDGSARADIDEPDSAIPSRNKKLAGSACGRDPRGIRCFEMKQIGAGSCIPKRHQMAARAGYSKD